MSGNHEDDSEDWEDVGAASPPAAAAAAAAAPKRKRAGADALTEAGSLADQGAEGDLSEEAANMEADALAANQQYDDLVLDLDGGDEYDDDNDAVEPSAVEQGKGGGGGKSKSGAAAASPAAPKPAGKSREETAVDARLRHATLVAHLASLALLNAAANDAGVQTAAVSLVARDMIGRDGDTRVQNDGSITPSFALVKRLLCRAGFSLQTMGTPEALKCRPAAVTKWCSLLGLDPTLPIPSLSARKPASSAASSAAASASAADKASHGPSAASIALEVAAFREARARNAFAAAALADRAPLASSPAVLRGLLAERRLTKACMPLQHVLLVCALFRGLGFPCRLVYAPAVLDFADAREVRALGAIARDRHVKERRLRALGGGGEGSSGAARAAAAEKRGGSDGGAAKERWAEGTAAISKPSSAAAPPAAAAAKRPPPALTTKPAGAAAASAAASSSAAQESGGNDSDVIVIDDDDDDDDDEEMSASASRPPAQPTARRSLLILDDDDDEEDAGDGSEHDAATAARQSSSWKVAAPVASAASSSASAVGLARRAKVGTVIDTAASAPASRKRKPGVSSRGRRCNRAGR